MSDLSNSQKSINPNQSFRLGVIFCKTGIVILPQGRLSLSYKQLLSAIATLLFFSAGWVSFSPKLSNIAPYSGKNQLETVD
ncbi:MAG TPA: hypothetical protein DCF68_10780 [Cyanothece sp. UBA12306]|nr:hypothetical protein [Cyanothece sp. UBA12306]